MPASLEELNQIEALISSWAENLAAADGPVADVERTEVDGNERGWYMRLEGEQKQFFSIIFQLGQRTLQYESYFIPAPLENPDAVYALLLKKNHKAHGATFSIGPESAIYIVGRVFVSAVNLEELDRILGSVYTYTERHFRPAMRLAFGERFKG